MTSQARTADSSAEGLHGNFKLAEATFATLRRLIDDGVETCVSITEAYLGRIEQLDRAGPELRAISEVNPDALYVAAQRDREVQAGVIRGPLHGMPILLKDNIGTADGMTTTAGSTALLGSIPPNDAFVAAKLRGAGAILLGKTNMGEWAGFMSFVRGTVGWSARSWNAGSGGLCRNPYALDRAPGGSSSGSAVACAANLAAAALGTETDGSIVGPAARNSIVGLKPTVGLVSRAGTIPISRSQDSVGPMARTVEDVAVLLGVLTGVDPRDPHTSASSGHARTDYTGFLDPDGLRGARIGVARGYMGFDERVDGLVEEACALMQREGAVIIDPIDLPPTLRIGNEDEREVLLHEYKAGINEYLAHLGPDAPVHSLSELIDYNRRNAALELGLFPQELLEQANERGDLCDPRYMNALANSHRTSRDEGIDLTMDSYELDAIVTATLGLPELADHTGASMRRGGGSATPSAMAGYPNMSVPMGFLFGLPVGLSLFGRAWSEGTLIRIAYAYEQTTRARQQPRFLAVTPRRQ